MSTQKDRLVRERAYHLWEAGGRQDGRSHEHWQQAETEIGSAGPAKAEPAGKKAGPAKKAPATAAKAPPPKAAATKTATKPAAKPGKAAKASPAKTT